MKNQFVKISALCMLLTGSFTTLQSAPILVPIEAVAQPMIPGILWFKDIQADYKNGKFDRFFQLMEERYNEEMQNSIQDEQQQEIDQIIADDKQHKAFTNEWIALQDRRDEQLKALAAKHVGETMSEMILTRIRLTEEERKALEFINTLDSPGVVLIEDVETQTAKQIVREYHLKHTILMVALAEHQEWAQDLPFDRATVSRYNVALEIQKYERLQALAKEHPGTVCTQQIDLAAAAFPKIASDYRNRGYLRELTSGERPAQTEMEKQVVEVLKENSAQLRALHQKYFN